MQRVGRPCPWPGESEGVPLWGRPKRQRNCFQSRAASVSMATRSAPSARAPGKAPRPTRWPPSRVVLRVKDFPQSLGFSPPGAPGREGHRLLVLAWVRSSSDSPSASLTTVFGCPQPPLAAELVPIPIPLIVPLPTLTQIAQKQLTCSLSFKKSAICPNSHIKGTCKEQFIIKFAFPSVNARC